MSDDSPKFESWGILEVMGHSRFAGFITSQSIGGVNMIRVDVPEVPAGQHSDARPAFTKMFTQQAIFALTPTTEQTARAAAASFLARAMSLFEMPMHRLPATDEHSEDEEDY